MKKIILLAGLSLLTHITQARASDGVSTSGGGFAIVCRDRSKQIISAELLDLVEAKYRYNLKIMAPSGSALKDYAQSIKNTYSIQTIKSIGHEDISTKFYYNFMNLIDWVESKDQLNLTYDLGNISSILPILGNYCDVEQVAFFSDSSDRVQILKNIWVKMSSLSQAALIQHELIYRNHRRYTILPEKTSEKTRIDTALIFSENVTPIYDGVPKHLDGSLDDDKILHWIEHDRHNQSDLSSNVTEYWSIKIGGPTEQQAKESGLDYHHYYMKQIMRHQFSDLAGRAVLSKTYYDAPQGVNLYDKFPIVGLQFQGWYVQALPSKNASGLAMRVFNENNEFVIDLQ